VISVNEGIMPIVGPTGVVSTLENGGSCLIVGLDIVLGEGDGEVGNDGMMWPWQADGGRFLSLSWALVEEHAMVQLAIPKRMLGTEVSRWSTRACLLM
jgi:hypothetical protein